MTSCDMRIEPFPHHFARCVTHETTFAVGTLCPCLPRCEACGEPAEVFDTNHECPKCAEYNPVERAAKAMYAHMTAHPWEETTPINRESFREYATVAIKAAIRPTELMERLNEEGCCDPGQCSTTLINHMLGTQPPPDPPTPTYLDN